MMSEIEKNKAGDKIAELPEEQQQLDDAVQALLESMEHDPIQRTEPERKQKAKNPIAALFAKHRQERTEQKIRADTVRNEQKMIDLLESIDFSKSLIPQEELNYKTNEDQPCGDLEYGVRAAVHDIKKNSICVRVNLQPIDEKIVCLIAYLNHSVRFGKLEAANAAKTALLRSLKEIRDKVPEVMPEHISCFIEQGTKYLDAWVTQVELAMVEDRLKVIVEQQKAEYEKARKEYDQLLSAFKEELGKDPIKVQAAMELEKQRERECLSAAAQELRDELIQQHLERKLIDAKTALYRFRKKELQATSEQVEILKVKLNSVDPMLDSNDPAKYQAAIDDILEDLHKRDIEKREAEEEYQKRVEKLGTWLDNLRDGTCDKITAIEALDRTLQDLQEQERMRPEQRDPEGGGPNNAN